ncbi:MAG: ATP-dependent DNA ligase [Vicinamibacteria bacterium]|nr:ATP-dependent DNA ligase [Vicinamibacteria bacterium]
MTLQRVSDDAVLDWLLADGAAAAAARSRRVLGLRFSTDDVAQMLDVPPHLPFAVEGLAEQEGEDALKKDALDAIPFVSLCRGALLPLSGMARERARALLGVDPGEPLATEARLALARRFLGQEIGLTVEERVALLMGDVFAGRRGGVRRDTLLALAASLDLVSFRALRDRLTRVADVAAVVAELRPVNPPPPPLTAREVVLTLRRLPRAGQIERGVVCRSLLQRMGRCEAYFFCRLLLRKGTPGFDLQREDLARLVAERFGVDAEAVVSAAAIADLPEVTRVLERKGEAGLRRIRLQPLVAVRPALAGPSVDEGAVFPVWFERKYDGIRLLLHKETDAAGNVLCAAFTRQRNDWTELIPGIETIARALPARRVIVDGELHALVVEQGRTRPGTVYELHAALTGERRVPLRMRYAAFDVLYLDGQDLTSRPFTERRSVLERLVRPIAGWPLPIPIIVSDGQIASSRDDLRRLFQFFRGQGYEGGVAKAPDSSYHLGRRDRAWMKMKPEITLDLALIGAFYSMGSGGARGFGSYLLGARSGGGEMLEVGEVAGVDREGTLAITQTIAAHGLLSGRAIERPGATGAKIGVALLPAIVVTVRFEGIVRDTEGRLALRDPKIVALRPDKPAAECDLASRIEEISLRGRLG